jgi:hypothetical protein
MSEVLPDQPAAEAPRPGFWQRKWVQQVIPLATSLGVHASLLLLGLLTYTVVQQSLVRPVEQVIIPDATLIEGAEIGSIPNPGLTNADPNRSAAQSEEAQAKTNEHWNQRKSESFTQALMSGPADSAGASVIGLGPRQTVGGRAGQSHSTGGGDPAGQLAPFGLPGGGASLGPRTNFIGVSGNARKVVYLCDTSGSMMDVGYYLRRELKSSIEKLRPVQQFNVIFFKEGPATPFRSQLVVANPENKRQVFEFIDKFSMSGGTDPTAAIREAFRQSPELIYVLTDGFDRVGDPRVVEEEFRRLNKQAGNRVKVNTILIRARDDENLVRVLQNIAKDNGGRFKEVSKSDL